MKRHTDCVQADAKLSEAVPGDPGYESLLQMRAAEARSVACQSAADAADEDIWREMEEASAAHHRTMAAILARKAVSEGERG